MGDAPSDPGDEAIMRIAHAENRVLVTLDKDFGELAFHRGLPASCGIVLLRIPPVPGLVTEYVRKVFDSKVDYRGLFIVVEEGRIRERPLPAGLG